MQPALRSQNQETAMSIEKAPSESTLSTVLWTGGALLVVAVFAVYAAM